ncbi:MULTISPECIES: enterochelin esterase [unclassified Pseudomonas]|uniref:enterochelin esterase n=1 Tax=unclassified Pseudomonas TaxID=196821 RepID=UPI0024480CB5|nr:MULTISPECIES: enterochelin esterase [unclassified Pseudomonas]MDG9925063.1 enterochelin esterase [Pseudomonas sp. GD04045]MDH0037062.1 enterochelin esterase [Pseudomonas sp. GD04019]
MVSRLPLLAGVLCLGLGSFSAQAEEARHYEGRLDERGAREYRLHFTRGDYLSGELPSAAMQLDLRTADGDHLRRLVAKDAGRRAFQLVLPEDGDYRLRLQGVAGAEFRLQLSAVTPLAAQRAPAEQLQSPRLRALQAELAAGGDSRDFWCEMGKRGTPLIEALDEREALVTFLWRGAERNVRLFGGPGYDHSELARLGDSDVWFVTFRLPRETRLAYQLAPDVPELDADPGTRRRAILATAQADPLNPRAYPAKGVDGFQYDSLLELDRAPPQPWNDKRAGVAAGSVERHAFTSKILGNSRAVYLYRPHGYRAGAADNHLLYLFDAEAYLGKVPTPTILDNLIAAGRIPPMAAVLIDNASPEARGVELPPNPDFARFLAEELQPWVAQQGLSVPAPRTVIAGSSYGGLASSYAALRHPELFGNVLSQSGSYWWSPPGQEPEWLTREFVRAPRLPVRFYLEAGQFEAGNGQLGIFDTTRHLRDVLQAKGYAVTHREWASGHDYLNWRGTLAEGLIALFGR